MSEINKYLNNEKEIPDWLGRGRTVLIPKSNDNNNNNEGHSLLLHR